MAEVLPPANAPVLVTGASGFIGRHLLLALQRQGRRVKALVRRDDGLAVAFPGLEVIRADVGDLAAYRSGLEPGMTVIHLAAVRAIPGTRRANFHRVNVDAALAFAETAGQAGVKRFLHVSAALVYGCTGVASADETASPSEPPFVSGYLESRLEALRRMRDLATRGLPIVTLCPTIVFGPDTPDHPNRLAGQMRWLLRHRIDRVIGGGAQRRTLAFVGDVVRGMLLAETRAVPGAEYILGGHDVSPREFNRRVLAAAGVTPRLSLSLPAGAVRVTARWVDRCRGSERGCGYEAALDMYTHAWCYSSGKAASELGYSVTPIDEALAETVRVLVPPSTRGAEATTD